MDGSFEEYCNILFRKRSPTKNVFCGSGGIVFWADTVGADHVYKSLKKWSEEYGNFYRPSRFLEERATRGIPLVSNLSKLTVDRIFCKSAGGYLFNDPVLLSLIC